MTIELVVFDMAGTTVDDQGVVNRCFRESLAAQGLIAEPEAVDAVMGLPKPEAFRILIGRSDLAGQLAGKLDAIHADFVSRMVKFYRDDPSVREVPGSTALFAKLKAAGVKIGVDTGFSREIADTILKRLGWNENGLIDASVCSDEVSRGRPHADMIIKLMTRLGVTDPKRVIKVGDAPADLDEGFAANCRWVVGVTWGSHSRDQLERYAHTHLVDSMDELTRLLDTVIPASRAS